MSALFELELPSELNTKEPPERRGLHAEVEGSDSTNRRLWKIRFSRCGTELLDLIYRLGGVRIANLTLHTGLSSYLDDELDREHPPSEEEYFISEETAEKIRDAHQTGRRVIAVGTTVVRALESAAERSGFVEPGHRYTRLTINAGYPRKSFARHTKKPSVNAISGTSLEISTSSCSLTAKAQDDTRNASYRSGTTCRPR